MPELIEQKTVATKSYSGLRKAAILLVAIGGDAASQIMKNLGQREVERIAKEISIMRNVPSNMINDVIKEYYRMWLAKNYISEGGFEYAEQLLQKALGKEQAIRILQKMGYIENEPVNGFKLLEGVHEDQIVIFLQKEHPQTIALVLSQLEPKKAAKIFEKLPEDLAVDVTYRIARLGRISPELLDEVGGFIETHFKEQIGKKSSGTLDGQKIAADLLNMVGKAIERNVMDGLNKVDSELAVEIKNLMLVFDDLIFLDDRSTQRILKEVDNRTLAVAMKGASEEIKSKIFVNMSERAANMLKEEIDYLGPVRVKEVEDAQRNIMTVVGQLEESGEIIVSRDGSENDIIT